jgi:hypothetical protein
MYVFLRLQALEYRVMFFPLPFCHLRNFFLLC